MRTPAPNQPDVPMAEDPPLPDSPARATDHRITLPVKGGDAERLFVRRWVPAEHVPHAHPIVLLHDSLGSVALWRDFPALVCAATARPVIAYDRLGFGQSSPSHGLPSHDFVAEEAQQGFAAVCAAFAIERCVVLGHSVGGGMALHCAAQAPGRVEAVVTISAQAFVEDRTREGIRAAKQLFADARQFERLSRYHGDRARWVLDAWTETWLAPGFAGWSLAAVLPEVRCPVLVLHGELDEYGSSAQPARIERETGGPVRVELLTGLGHMPHREQPEAIARRVAAFLGAVAQA